MSRSMAGLVAWLIASSALAAGFALPEQSARAVGSGGTGTASVTGASAIYYNVGNLAFEDGINAEASVILIAPTFQYEPLTPGEGTPTSVEARLFTQPSLFAAAPVADGLLVGVGGFANYGLGLTWPADFAGRFEASSAEITAFNINPSAAYRISQNLGVGAGLSLVRATVELGQDLNFIDQSGSLRMGAGTWGFGFNAGIGARFLGDDLSVGLNFRSFVDLDFKGRADFTTPPEFAAALADQDVETSITLPNVLSAGVSYRVSPKVRVNLDLNYTDWSSMSALRLRFPENPSLDEELPRDWSDTFTVRAAVEAQLSQAVTLRVGTGFDPSPSPAQTLSPSLPDSDRLLASAGLGYRAGSLQADLGYLLVLMMTRESAPPAFPARYTGYAHLLALSVGFRQ